MERMPAGWWVIPELPALSIKEFKLRILSKNDDPQLSDLLKSPFIISEDKQSIQLDNTITSLKISKDTGAILELKSKNIPLLVIEKDSKIKAEATYFLELLIF